MRENIKWIMINLCKKIELKKVRKRYYCLTKVSGAENPKENSSTQCKEMHKHNPACVVFQLLFSAKWANHVIIE